jgi:hypothetical protein
MKAKTVNEKFWQDEESDPIHDMEIGDPKQYNTEMMQKFTEANGYKFGFNKNGTAYIAIPVDYEMMKSYDTLTWPTLVKEIRYTITYIPGRTDKFSLRKIWYGYESDATDYWGIYQDSKKFKKFRKDFKINKFKIKNLKQSLMGRFSNGRSMLGRIELSIKKELKK